MINPGKISNTSTPFISSSPVIGTTSIPIALFGRIKSSSILTRSPGDKVSRIKAHPVFGSVNGIYRFMSGNPFPSVSTNTEVTSVSSLYICRIITPSFAFASIVCKSINTASNPTLPENLRFGLKTFLSFFFIICPFVSLIYYDKLFDLSSIYLLPFEINIFLFPYILAVHYAYPGSPHTFFRIYHVGGD